MLQTVRAKQISQPFPFLNQRIIMKIPVTSSHKCHVHFLWGNHPWLPGYFNQEAVIDADSNFGCFSERWGSKTGTVAPQLMMGEMMINHDHDDDDMMMMLRMMMMMMMLMMAPMAMRMLMIMF